MGRLISTIRRAVLLAFIGALGGGAWVWWRDRRASSAPTDPPEWPPLTTVGGQTAATPVSRDAVSTSISTTEEAQVAPPEAAPATSNAPGSGSASIVNSLVDAPDARSDTSSGDWVAPLADGSCPPSHPVKANDNSGIYHVPGGRFYDRTKAERCYTTEAAAAADGYRPAKA